MIVNVGSAFKKIMPTYLTCLLSFTECFKAINDLEKARAASDTADAVLEVLKKALVLLRYVQSSRGHMLLNREHSVCAASLSVRGSIISSAPSLDASSAASGAASGRQGEEVREAAPNVQ